jgi:hypothetical protein
MEERKQHQPLQPWPWLEEAVAACGLSVYIVYQV